MTAVVGAGAAGQVRATSMPASVTADAESLQ